MRRLGSENWLALVACLGVLTGSLAMVGCGPAPTETPAAKNQPPVAADELEHLHDGDHKHAATYPEAITMLEGMRDKIRDAFAKGEAQSADETVHEIGHALEDVTELAKKASFSEEDQVAVGTAVESLLDAFGKIDDKLHGGDGVDYDQVATDIDAAFETLKKFVPATK
jgi:hypothetical protein